MENVKLKMENEGIASQWILKIVPGGHTTIFNFQLSIIN